jgi:hypothetical protein
MRTERQCQIGHAGNYGSCVKLCHTFSFAGPVGVGNAGYACTLSRFDVSERIAD